MAGYTVQTPLMEHNSDDSDTTSTTYVVANTVQIRHLTGGTALVSNATGGIANSMVTATELDCLSGVTSAIQTQLGGKQATITGAASSVVSTNLTGDRVLVSDSSGKIANAAVTTTALGYLDATSSVQTQLNQRANLSGGVAFDGKVALSGRSAGNVLVLDATGNVVTSPVSSTTLGYLDATSSVQTQLNQRANLSGGVAFDGKVALTGRSAGNVLVLDGTGNVVTSPVSSTTLGYLDATSSVQTQLNAKQATITGSASSVVATNLSAGKVLITDDSQKIATSAVTSTTLGYLDATSSVQTQLNGKQATITGAASSVVSTNLGPSTVVIADGSGKLANAAVTTTTLGYLDATSSIQTQLNAKQAIIVGAVSGYTVANLTQSRVVVSDADGKIDASLVSSTTLGYLDATSSVQTQLNQKANTAGATFSGLIKTSNNVLEFSNALANVTFFPGPNVVQYNTLSTGRHVVSAGTANVLEVSARSLRADANVVVVDGTERLQIAHDGTAIASYTSNCLFDGFLTIHGSHVFKCREASGDLRSVLQLAPGGSTIMAGLMDFRVEDITHEMYCGNATQNVMVFQASGGSMNVALPLYTLQTLRNHSNVYEFQVPTSNVRYSATNVVTYNVGVGGWHSTNVGGAEVANVSAATLKNLSNVYEFQVPTSNVRYSATNVVTYNVGVGGWHATNVGGAEVANVSAATLKNLSNVYEFQVATSNIRYVGSNVVDYYVGATGGHSFNVGAAEVANVTAATLKNLSNVYEFQVATSNLRYVTSNVLAYRTGATGGHATYIGTDMVANVTTTALKNLSNSYEFFLPQSNISYAATNVINYNTNSVGFHVFNVGGAQVANVGGATLKNLSNVYEFQVSTANVRYAATNVITYNTGAIGEHEFRVGGALVANVDAQGIAVQQNYNLQIASAATAGLYSKIVLRAYNTANASATNERSNVVSIGQGSAEQMVLQGEEWWFRSNNKYAGKMYYGPCTVGASTFDGGKLRLANAGTSETAPANYQLQVHYDSAAKPGGGSWTSSSDQRVKANIELANLDLCTQVLRALPLKRFEWTSPIKDVVGDYRVLGWIAQDVKAYLPKSVVVTADYGFEDFHSLNADQIDKVAYGALQKAWEEIDALKARVAALESR